MKIFEFDDNIVGDEQDDFGEESVLNHDRVKKAAEFINVHCSDAVEAFLQTDQLLFHGNRGLKGFIAMGSSPEHRRPKDTNPNTQRLIDYKLREAGFKALRSNSIFATSRYGVTKQYGRTYVLFPLNGFDFTWSNKIQDIWSVADFDSGNFMRDLRQSSPADFIAEWDFRKNDFPAALNRGHEIMIHGKVVAVSAIRQYLDAISPGFRPEYY